jgi:hypothetical protein
VQVTLVFWDQTPIHLLRPHQELPFDDDPTAVVHMAPSMRAVGREAIDHSPLARA